MIPGEVQISKEDKEKILAHWREITDTLDKYDWSNGYTNWVTTMSRVKSIACDFSTWINLLHIAEENPQ
ncbi:hypothetical protein IKF88_02330 [Candidatus Saccharibacteria bacterium]|nr:hypothetical protein [Candidatus Saccharibacteria bacterium]